MYIKKHFHVHREVKMKLREMIEESIGFINRKIGSFSPDIGVILGTGLSFMADEVKDKMVIPYAEIPHFPTSTVQGHEGNFVFLKDLRKNEILKISADFVIGADGARSTVARLTGKYTKKFLITAQYTLRLKKKLDDLLIFFRDYIKGGYGWIFPKGDIANVGVGIDLDYRLNVVEVLNKFVKELEDFIYIKTILGRTGGFIPGEGIVKPLRGKFLLVGDAGGFCHPITGGGIANAVITGDMAGRAILEGEIKEYEEESMDTLGQSINRAAEKRRRFMKEWDNLEFRIPKTWIAFEEYYKD